MLPQVFQEECGEAAFGLFGLRGLGEQILGSRLLQLFTFLLSLIYGRRSPHREFLNRGMDVKGSWRWVVAGCLLVLVCMWGVLPSQAGAQQIQWSPYEEALEEAQKTGRPVLLYFFVKDCQYCQQMESKTLSAGRVVEYLREEFVSARVDGDKSPQLARRYMVRGFPTIWFLGPDGKPISSLPGYVGPEDLAKVLRYIRGGHYRSKSLREYLSGS